MEVVCLILGPTLTSQPCLHAFWVLTSLHLLSFLLKMFLLFLYVYSGVETASHAGHCPINLVNV